MLESQSREKISQARTALLLTRWVESIFEWFEPSVIQRSETLTTSFVQNIYAVSAAMPTRNSSSLTVKAHTKPTKVAKLTHLVLDSAKDIVATGDANGNGALNTPMSQLTVRSEARGLERENLIRSKLLLIKCLLLLLQCFDLLLKGDLSRNSVGDKRLCRRGDLPVQP